MHAASSSGVDSFISVESLDPIRLWPSAFSPLLWLTLLTRRCPINHSFRLCLLPRHGFGLRRCLINFLWKLLTRRSLTARRRLTPPFHLVAYFDPKRLLLSALSHRPFISLDPLVPTRWCRSASIYRAFRWSLFTRHGLFLSQNLSADATLHHWTFIQVKSLRLAALCRSLHAISLLASLCRSPLGTTVVPVEGDPAVPFHLPVRGWACVVRR
jgi:hypothetical protein